MKRWLIEAAFHIVGTLRHTSSDANGVPENELLSKDKRIFCSINSFLG